MAKKLRSAAEGFLENAKDSISADTSDVRRAISQPKQVEAKPQTVTQTNKGEALKKETMQVKKSIGQPRKYDEPTKHVSFALPLSVVENLKILAGLKRTNQTQLILSLIQEELTLNADKIETYKELMD